MRSLLLPGIVILLVASFGLFQNCSTDFGNANNPVANQNGGTSGVSFTYHWVTVNGPCSAQCGAGTQTPIAFCQDQFGNSNTESHCTLPKPTLTPLACQTQACATYTWVTALTGSCVATSGNCGAGTQTQTVSCNNQASQVVPDSFCSGSSKPATSVVCQTGISCLPRPAPNSYAGCNPGIFDHCTIDYTTHVGQSGTVSGSCESGFAATNSSGCYATCHANTPAKGAPRAEQWWVYSSCGHAGANTQF